MADETVKVKTQSGLAIEIDPAVWDDMEVLDLLVDLSSGDPVRTSLAVPDLLNKLFSPAQKKALYDHVRTEDGRVPVHRVTEELMEILQEMKEGKKQ